MKIFGILLLVACSGALADKIQPQLLSKLEAGESSNIFVSFHSGTSSVFKTMEKIKLFFTSRTERATKLNSLLIKLANITQGAILDFIEKTEARRARSFWISNQIFIENASLRLVKLLAKFPTVSAITEDEVVAKVDASVELFSESAIAAQAQPLTWGLDKIEVQDVWDLGNRGEGVVVGGIDTGVRGTHEALRNNYIGEYGWFDPTKTPTSQPSDTNGHGTHSMATAVGSHGVGVAPGAKWMACKGCASDGCYNSDLLACGQFMQCPTLPDGSNPNCSKAPKVVINSWGSAGGNTFYDDIVKTWYLSGIIGVFANGNRRDFEPVCGGAGSPADSPYVIAVGNTNEQDGLTPSSQQGPTKAGTIKPDVSAPGNRIKSAYINSDRSYALLTGTSMACPHVAGIVALLVKKKPNLTTEQARQSLIAGCEKTGLRNPQNNCGGVRETRFPNNAFGHGRVSALKSYNWL